MTITQAEVEEIHGTQHRTFNWRDCPQEPCRAFLAAKPERIARPLRHPGYPPQTMTDQALRSAEDAIYTHKNILADEHFLRTGHEPEKRVSCEVCSLIVAGTTSDPRGTDR